MAKVQVLGQCCPYGGKMLIRGVFSQKKKLWEALIEISGESKLLEMIVIGEVGYSEMTATYTHVCNRLRVMGRVALAYNGIREFQIVDVATNEIRAWDIEEDGPVCNPVIR